MQWKIYELEKLRTISYVFMIQMQSLELFYEFQFWRGEKSWFKRKLKHAFEHENKTGYFKNFQKLPSQFFISAYDHFYNNLLYI